MGDDQGRGLHARRGHRAKWNKTAGGRLDVNLVEVTDRVAKLRGNLQHDPVLVKLGENHGNLPLTKGIVESVVYCFDGNVQPRGPRPINLHMQLEPAHLLIARHISELRKRSQLVDEPWSPLSEFGVAGILEDVLILRAARPSIDLEVLCRLEKRFDALNAAHSLAQTRDDLTSARISRLPRLEDDVKPARVRGRVYGAGTDKCRDALDVRVAPHDIRNLPLQREHGGKGYVLSRIGNSNEQSGILLRQKALWHEDIKDSRRDKGRGGDKECSTLVTQYPDQRSIVLVKQAVKCALEEPLKRVLSLFGFPPQHFRAHHWCQRQRNKGGNSHGRAQRDGKLSEEPAHNSRHKQERNKDGDEREAERNDCEANLLRALQRRFKRVITLLDVSENVLDHYNRIIHHEAGRDRQRHERQIVEAEPRQIHHRKCSEQ